MRPALLDLALQSWYYDGATAKTRNLGVAGGACQLGDGVTPATFPTQLGVAQGVLRGMSVAAGQYLKGGTLSNGTYTVYALLNKLSALATNNFVFDFRSGGGAGYLYTPSGTPTVLSASTGTVYVNEEVSTTTPYGPVCCVAVSGITLSAPSFMALFASQALAESWIGGFYGLRLFPGTHTARQVRDQRQRLLARVHGP